MHGRGKKLSKSKTQNIRNLFLSKKKKNKDRIIRAIWTVFETEKDKKKKERHLKKYI